jgi:hypothetical protein
MNTLAAKIIPIAVDTYCDTHFLHVILADGREICAPLEWFPRLYSATEEQRKNWRLIGDGIGLHWEDVDEDISISSLLATH